MSLHTSLDSTIPEETIRVAHAAFPKGNVFMQMRDALGPLYTNAQFAPLFSHTGQPAEDPARLALVRTLWEALVPYGTGGTYVSNVGSEADEGAAGLRAAYGANYKRLMELKQKYDPSNFFRSNRNIRPTLAEATAR
jgi:FAD/FMN-containing dehydrogenase